MDVGSVLGAGEFHSSCTAKRIKALIHSVSSIILLMKKKLSISFYLDCFTSSSQSFSIPFVGGVGPQIKCSQCNKGQLQRTAETEENGSKRIRK